MGCSVGTNSAENPTSLVEDPLLRLQKELQAQSESSEASLQTLMSSLRIEIEKRENQCKDLELTVDRLKSECRDLEAVKNRLHETQTTLAMKEQIVAKLEGTLEAAHRDISELRLKLAEFEELQKRAAAYEAQIRELNEGLTIFRGKEVQWLKEKNDFEGKIQALRVKQELLRKAKRHYDSELSEKLVKQHMDNAVLSEQVQAMTNSQKTLTEKRAKSLKIYSLTLMSCNGVSLEREAFLTWRTNAQHRDETQSMTQDDEKPIAVLRLATIIRSGLIYAFLTWKTANRASLALSESFSDTRSVSMASSDLDFSFSFEREEVPAAGANLFEKILNLPPSRWGTAMNKLKVAQIIEELLDRKYELDLASLAESNTIRSFSECISDYFTRKLGLARLAIKEIGVFLPGLSKLNREGMVTAVLFCRIAGFFADNILPPEVGTFIVHARGKFLSMVVNTRKRGITKGKAEFQSPKKKTNEEELQIIEVIPLALDLFSRDRACAERFLMLLRPEKVLHSEFVLFLMCFDITKQGGKAEALFAKFDVEKKGWLSPSELSASFSTYLKIWLSPVDLEQAFTALPPAKGKLTAKDLSKALKLDQFPMVRFSPVFSVSKTNFLLKLIATYTDMVERHKTLAREVFARHCGADKSLSAAGMELALSEFTGATSSEVPGELQNFSAEQFVSWVFSHNVGNLALGPFKSPCSETLMSPVSSPIKSPNRTGFEAGSPSHHKRSDSTASS